MKSLEQKFNGELFFFVKKRTTIGSQENGKDTPYLCFSDTRRWSIFIVGIILSELYNVVIH